MLEVTLNTVLRLSINGGTVEAPLWAFLLVCFLIGMAIG